MKTTTRRNFPAKPLGCYGDGGAVFTDNDEWARSISEDGLRKYGSLCDGGSLQESVGAADASV